MIIKDIIHNNDTYTILYYYNEDPSTFKKVVGKLSANHLDPDCLNRISLSPDSINDSVSIEGNPDDYLILIPKDYPIMPDDTCIPLGLVRYYIMYHMDDEEILSFDIIEKEEELDATELQFAIQDFIGWV